MQSSIPSSRTLLLLAVIVALVAVAFWWSKQTPPEKPVPFSPSTEVNEPKEVDTHEILLGTIGDPKQPLEERLNAIRQLGSTLPPVVVEDVVALVRELKKDETVRNDLIDVLLVQRTPVQALGPLLLRLHAAEDETPRMRSYALQHMAEATLRGISPDILVGVLVEAAQAKNSDAGTALLSLDRIGEKRPEVLARARKIGRAALEDGRADTTAAIVGMQMASDAKDVSVLEKARTLAVQQDAQTRLRMSAIHTLGSLGTAEDLKILIGLGKDTNYRIKQAAKANRTRLERRLKG